MIVIFGKGKVGTSLEKLLNKLEIENILMDDKDWNEKILAKSEKIISSPGIKQNHQLYQKYGEKVFSELNFLGDLIKELGLEDKIEVVGVTGTNGKSTSVHILYNMFKGIFKKIGIETKVHLSGNFGTPLSESLIEILEDGLEQKHLIILEVSSFMLYKLNNFYFDYSILTNIGLDHLDWHKDLDEYIDSKFKIIDYCKKYAVMDPKNLELYMGKNVEKNLDLESFENNFELQKTKFLGKHNEGNWNALTKIIKRYFLDHNLVWDENIFWDIAGNIDALDHRMKLVKEIDGIKIYDDGISTSSQSLKVALDSFENQIILIAGGYDKGDDYNLIKTELKDKLKFACLIGQTAQKFKEIFDKEDIEYEIFDSLEDALNNAIIQAKKTGTKNILFSPGSASFDMFKDVYDRCEQFSKLIDIL